MAKIDGGFAVTTLVNLTKTEDRKKKIKKYKGERISIKKLVSEKTIKKTKKAAYLELLGSNIGTLCAELEKFYLSKKGSKVFDDREDIIEVFCNEKFCRTVCKVCKEMKDSKNGIPEIIVVAISDMFVNGDKMFMEPEICKKYMKVVDMYKGKEIRKLAKKLDLSKDEKPKTQALALILTSFRVKRLNGKISLRRALSFLGLIYDMNDVSEKTVKKILKECYGKDLSYILGIALNEKYIKDNENFSVVTNAILEVIEKMDRDDRNELLKKYAKRRRERNNNVPRRLNLLSINEEDYKNIHKTMNKLMKAGYKKEIFS